MKGYFCHAQFGGVYGINMPLFLQIHINRYINRPYAFEFVDTCFIYIEVSGQKALNAIRC